MSASWDAFGAMLNDECRLLGELNSAALALTEALVFNNVERIHAAERRLEAQRLLHHQVYHRRTTMMTAGFGDLTLAQVCTYAPGKMRRRLEATFAELTIRGISLQITVNNNKALILAGMDRIQKTVNLIQDTMIERPGTYRRHGNVPKPAGSVIVSRKA